MVSEILSQTGPKFDKAIEHLNEELKSIRTGRATVSLVDGITVEVYGQHMPLRQLATLGTPDAHTIAITPWDRATMPMVEKAIRDSQSLGLTPNNDGTTIRLNIPQLTEDRRREIAKTVGDKVEQCRVALRNGRHEALDEVRRAAKNKLATEDDVRYTEEQLNKKIDEYQKKIEVIQAAKEQEIMSV